MGNLIGEHGLGLLVAFAAGVWMGWRLRGDSPRTEPGAPEPSSSRSESTEGQSHEPMGLRHPVETIQGIGPSYGAHLREIGVTTTLDLAQRCSTAARREEVVEALGVSERLVRRWVSMADLLRIPGMGPQDAELLEAVGVASVPELLERDPSELATLMASTNEDLHLSPDGSPGADKIVGWMGAARLLADLVPPG